MELQIKDLRLGNLIKIASVVQKVKSFGTDSVGEYIETEDYITYAGEEWNAAELIPLDDEWLEKMGFNGGFLQIKVQNVKDYGRPEYNRVVKISFQDDVFEMWHMVLDHEMCYNDELYEDTFTPLKYPHIRYIHQVQNLYHVLTGGELKIEGYE
jgi:hypothetical protein